MKHSSILIAALVAFGLGACGEQQKPAATAPSQPTIAKPEAAAPAPPPPPAPSADTAKPAATTAAAPAGDAKKEEKK